MHRLERKGKKRHRYVLGAKRQAAIGTFGEPNLDQCSSVQPTGSYFVGQGSAPARLSTCSRIFIPEAPEPATFENGPSLNQMNRMRSQWARLSDNKVGTLLEHTNWRKSCVRRQTDRCRVVAWQPRVNEATVGCEESSPRRRNWKLSRQLASMRPTKPMSAKRALRGPQLLLRR